MFGFGKKEAGPANDIAPEIGIVAPAGDAMQVLYMRAYHMATTNPFGFRRIMRRRL